MFFRSEMKRLPQRLSEGSKPGCVAAPQLPGSPVPGAGSNQMGSKKTRAVTLASCCFLHRGCCAEYVCISKKILALEQQSPDVVKRPHISPIAPWKGHSCKGLLLSDFTVLMLRQQFRRTSLHWLWGWLGYREASRGAESERASV